MTIFCALGVGLGSSCTNATTELLLPPWLEVDPPAVDFGEVAIGEQRSLQVRLHNRGAWPLPLLATTITADHGDFKLVDPPPEVAARGVENLEVSFVPSEAGLRSAAATVEFDGEVAYPYLDVDAQVLIPLKGQAQPRPSQLLAVRPVPLRLPSPMLGCGATTAELTIRNISEGDVQLLSLQLEGSEAFGLSASTGMPLAPGDEKVVSVQMAAESVGPHRGELAIRATDGARIESLTSSLVGEVLAKGRVVDTFGAGRTKRDILLIVDDSCSMQQEQEQLAQNFDAFIDMAVRSDIDWRIAVTTTDISDGAPSEGGRFVPLAAPEGRVISPTSLPSPAEVFRANVQVGVDGLTQVEQGLEATRLALSEPLISEHNRDFLRDDADLVVVIVSDEDDQSPLPPQRYAEFLRGLKSASGAAVSLAGIIGPPPVGCIGPNGTAIGGNRYQTAIELLGGSYESICTTDWATSLRAISRSTFKLPRQLPLSYRAQRDSVVVTVDDLELPREAWTYLRDVPAILLEGEVSGSSANVSYTPQCDAN